MSPYYASLSRVTQITESAEEILQREARAREETERKKAEALRAKQDAEDRDIQVRIRNRIATIAKEFPKLRMVIGGPCYMWGIDAEIEYELKQAGMDVVAWPNAPLLAPHSSHTITEDVMLYNVVIFGDTFHNKSQPDPNTGKIPDRVKRHAAMLRRFLEAGGGIWFSGLANQDWGRTSHSLNYILKELNLDAEVVGEAVMDTSVMKKGSRLGDYAWADVMPDPLTKGVKNLLHPGGVISGEGSMGVVPIVRLGPEWRVLLKGKPTAASFPCEEGYAAGRLLTTPRTVKSSPILAAVRQAGKGRVVLWPTWSNFTVTGGSGGKLLDGRKDGRYSDGARLIENLLCWLAEPSQGSKPVGTFDPEKYERAARKKVDVDARLKAWAKPGRRDYPNQYKGLIGAHSDLSDGKSSPEQMIAAANKDGYDFIAFTEDFARMNEKKWKKLVAVCDRANKADANFVAYPGLDFVNEAGNRGLVFGHRYWIKDEWRSKQHPDRIRWWYNLTYQADCQPRRWLPRVTIRSRTNNKRPWNQGLWSFFGAYCYEAGKLVDDSFHEWRPLIGPHVFFLNTGIMAAHTVRSVAEIAATARPGLFQTYVKADNLGHVLKRLSGCTGTGFMGYFPTYISTGPEILDFRCYAAVMGGEISFDLAAPGNERGLLHILVKAGAGLEEVSVYDGDRLFRRFMPSGKQFEAFVSILGDACHCYSLTVTDIQGRKAVSWNAFLQIQEKVHRRCGDNWNWMTTGKGPGRLGPVKLGYSLHEVTSGWTSARWTPASDRRKAAKRKYQCEQGNYGHGGLSGAINGYIHPHGLLVDGKPWPSTFPATSLNFHTTGRYGIVLTDKIRDDVVVAKREPASLGAFSGPYRAVPSPWPADLKQFFPMQKPEGATVNRYQARVTFAKSVATPDGQPVRLTLGATGNPSADTVEVMHPDGTSKRRHVGSQTLSGEIPKDGYVCWYDDEGDGVGGIIALTSGIKYSYTKKWQSCFVEVPSPVKPGTEVAWGVIFVTGDASTRNSNEQMEDVRVGMGIAGKPALYQVRPQIGTVINQRYFLTLQARDHAFSGKVVKSTAKPLPIHLPVMLRGLNPRWSAAIWYRGKTELHTPDYFRDPWGVST